jgi:hypothetical protein
MARRPIHLEVTCERTDIEKLRLVLTPYAEFILRFEHDGDHRLVIELSTDVCPSRERSCFELVLRRALEKCASAHKAPSTFPPRFV